ncbi:MAG: TIR domain-containing protein [Gammaproteobacteria bacterium]|nr:TIR domain-containing protein [Gammaproteobacteria bacterium]
MPKDNDTTRERMDIALARIAEEKLARTGHLSLADLGLRSLPDELFELTHLESLDLSRQPISDLAPLRGLQALTQLHCTGTPVADLSPLQGLQALTQLNCAVTRVADLSPLQGLQALSQLHCAFTQVADLSPLQGLQTLIQLDCSYTLVADLAPLQGLRELALVNCYATRVTQLPEWLIGAPNLRYLIAGGSERLSHIPDEVLSQKSWSDNCLQRLRDHYADLDREAEALRDVKLLVLGNGRIGKTQICRRLRGEGFEPDADSTHGITVHTQPFAMPDSHEDAQLNVWDFGGQDIYHGTHALFLRTRAVFLIVWTPDSESGDSEHGGMLFRNQPLAYWLDYVRHFGGADSPVLIVQNQCDGGRGQKLSLPVEGTHLAPFETGERFIRTLAYSAADQTGHAGLVDALQAAILDYRARHGMPKMGANRLRVLAQLQEWANADADRPEAKREHRLIPYATFEALCAEHEVHVPDTFVEVLHNAGAVYFQPELFDRQLVLDQSWALEKIYALFYREAPVYRFLRRQGGRFTRRDLHDLLWANEGLSEHDQQSLLGMMESSGICFVHRERNENGDTEYVAPELLPEGRAAIDAELAARWEPIPGEPHEIVFRYPFLAPAISRSVLSAIGREAGDSALYWRFGVCVYESQTHSTAIVEQAMNADGYGGVIRILAKGQRPAELAQRLAELIDRLNRRSDYPVERDETTRRAAAPDETPLTLTTPPPTVPALPEVFISYNWGQDEREPLVADLQRALTDRPYELIVDRTHLPVGDRISHFMDRLGEGRCIVVVISAGYLRSEYCLYELYRIWLTSKQRDADFLQRVVPLVQADTNIGSPLDRTRHAAHWLQQHGEIEALIREHGSSVIGEEDFHRHRLLGDFHRHIGDMLALINDLNVPRDPDTLRHDDFRVVRELIEKAIG